jgi:hypothetical protein
MVMGEFDLPEIMSGGQCVVLLAGEQIWETVETILAS